MVHLDTQDDGSSRRGFSTRSLYKAIFDSEAPEQFVRTIPAQSIYLVLKQRGLAACSEILDIAALQQVRVCLDLDLWNKDFFNEENFWEWLSLSDDEDPIRYTQKLLKAIDLKIISLLISKYVLTQVFDEPTEQPPGKGYFTPDKGYTWVYVSIEDGTKHFLFNRLLALIFETSSELFYQLISIPGVSTESMLEEEAYQDRSKRLAVEGIPELEFCNEINSSLSPTEAKKLIGTQERTKAIDVHPVEPLLYSSSQRLSPLAELIESVKNHDDIEAELSLIMNGSLQFFSIPFYEYELVFTHVEKVKGAINVGLESITKAAEITPLIAYESLGLQGLYKVGLYELRGLHSKVNKLDKSFVSSLEATDPLFSLIARLREPFPELPLFFGADGKYRQEHGKLLAGGRAITNISDITHVQKALKLKSN